MSEERALHLSGVESLAQSSLLGLESQLPLTGTGLCVGSDPHLTSQWLWDIMRSLPSLPLPPGEVLSHHRPSHSSTLGWQVAHGRLIGK